MHMEHEKLLQQIRAAGCPPARGRPGETDSYGGSGHLFYRVSVPARRSLAKHWLALHPDLSPAELLAVVSSLIAGASHEEKTLGPLLLGYCPSGRRGVGPAHVERWLEHLRGWAEVDALCQNVFSADELLADWRAWRSALTRMARDSNVHKRRASLVLLTGPTRYSADLRLRDAAFASIDRLRGERDILITKAISWLLRSMTTQHAAAVAAYIDANAQALPKIAVRETRTKLETGRKNAVRATRNRSSRLARSAMQTRSASRSER
jgi:3-methyladenine DNA glycosylase AlkD